MPHFSYLKRRPSGVYAVRFVVPAWLRPVVGLRELHRTTGCRDLALAKVVASEMVADWHRRLGHLRAMDPRKLKVGAVELLGDGELPLVEAARALGASPRDLAARLLDRDAPFFVQAQGEPGWRIPDLADLHDGHDMDGSVSGYDVTPRLLERLGERQRVTALLRIHIRQDVRAVLDAAQPFAVTLFTVLKSHLHATGGQLPAFVADDPGITLTVESLQVRRRDVEAVRQHVLQQIGPGELSAMVGEGAPAGNVGAQDSIAKSQYAARPVADLVAKFLEAKSAQVGCDEQRRLRDAGSALVELTKNLPLAAIDRGTIRALAANLAKAPRDRNKVRLRYGQASTDSWAKLIAVASQHGLPKLTPSSVERIVEDVQTIFAWGVTEGWLRENPASKLSGEVFKQLGGQRTPGHMRRESFSREDLARIFAVEWFVTGAGKKTAQGRYYSYRPYYFWLPLLGLYTGGRINELSQLYLDDIKKDDESGEWFIDFNLDQPDKVDVDEVDDDGEARSAGSRTGDKRLKTINSERVLPLHPRLVELGLVQYADELRKAGHERLFPELKHDAVKGYGKAATKWFNDAFLWRRLKIPRNGRKVFHSFRHNFITELERTQAPPAAIKQLAGHSMVSSAGGVTAGYTKARRVVELSPFVLAIAPALPVIAPFDIAEGLQAVSDALALKARHRGRADPPAAAEQDHSR